MHQPRQIFRSQVRSEKRDKLFGPVTACPTPDAGHCLLGTVVHLVVVVGRDLSQQRGQGCSPLPQVQQAEGHLNRVARDGDQGHCVTRQDGVVGVGVGGQRRGGAGSGSRGSGDCSSLHGYCTRVVATGHAGLVAVVVSRRGAHVDIRAGMRCGAGRRRPVARRRRKQGQVLVVGGQQPRRGGEERVRAE